MVKLTVADLRSPKAWSGVLLLVSVVLGVIASVTTWISQDLFSAVALTVLLVLLLFVYFGWLRVKPTAIAAIILAVLLAGVYWSKLPKVEAGQFQAVFLTNGQVYFGHFHNPESGTPTLTDVYYLQSSTAANPQDNKSSQSQAPLTLIKLGGELHGPEDKMAIKADQILFWENLKDSSKVVQTIKNQVQ